MAVGWVAVLGEAKKAKVFISCPSREDSEAALVREVSARLDALGYDPCVGRHDLPIRSVRDELFRQIETSEYFLLVDLARPGAAEGAGPEALLGSQELAVASYLHLPILVFRQEGCAPPAGEAGLVEAPTIAFAEPKRLPDLVEATLQTLGTWRPDWKHQLLVEPSDIRTHDGILPASDHASVRFFHVGVENLDPRRPATNCSVHLERVRPLGEDKDLFEETLELCWSGWSHPLAVICPGSRRYFEAFVVPRDAPDMALFAVQKESLWFRPEYRGPGRLRVTYLVTADGFPHARRDFVLHVGNELPQARLEPWELDAALRAEGTQPRL